MEQQQNQLSPKKSPLALAFNVLVVLLVVGAIGQVFQVRGLTDRVAELESQIAVEDKQATNDPNNSGWNTVVKSGKGGFEVTLPDGWGPIANDLESDFMIMPGTAQPTIAKGGKVTVNNIHGYGSDSASMFSISLSDKGATAPPQGTAEEFTFSNHKATEPITGTKYTYTYPKDMPAGIGYLRVQGDRDYDYVVPLGDKELRIFYSVYGSDPRNLVETVDRIVDTIKLSDALSANL